MKKGLLLSILLGSALVFTACSSEEIATETDVEIEGSEVNSDYPNADLLVDVDWVEENLTNQDVRFVDLRAEGFEGGHIPGAVHVTWQDLNDPDASVGGVLANEDLFEALMGELGINNDTLVIAYDDGNSMAAARLFYALEYYGHEQVKILNGGFTAWLTSGKDITTEAKEVEMASFTAEVNENLAVDMDFVIANLENDNCVILDARSPDEHSGEDIRAERGGHIPSSVNVDWTEANQVIDGVPSFKSKEDLEELFGAAGVDREKMIIPYCQTNVRGAHSYFVLRLLGFEDVRPYEGSWSEWGNEESAPITNSEEG
ncbi:sulfurtransferase [Bacillaceae bacterium IKA-2]|nr:sulfurtransferase [Bacillaceae bacterium IKA-2]